jgi:formate dehydrogenase major subunit
VHHAGWRNKVVSDTADADSRARYLRKIERAFSRHIRYFPHPITSQSHRNMWNRVVKLRLPQEARMIRELLLQWPVVRQILGGGDGTGPEAMSRRTHELRPKNEGAKVARSVCPYCAVGCGQLVFHREGKLVSIEGDPASPVSRGRLCPKGADSFELLTHSKRLTKVKYRRPFSKVWEDLDLQTAMEMIADRIWESRERTFVESKGGQSLMQTTAMGHLGGATLDNEENYLIKKLFTGGLGMVCVSNQARI